MLAKSLPRMTHRCLDPAPLSTSSCNCGRILCGNQRIAFVPAAGTLPGLFADFQQFLRGLLDAPATLRGHLAPEKVRMAATGAIPFAGRCGSEKAALIVRPLPFAVLGEASTAMLQPRCAAILHQKKSAWLRLGPSPSQPCGL